MSCLHCGHPASSHYHSVGSCEQCLCRVFVGVGRLVEASVSDPVSSPCRPDFLDGEHAFRLHVAVCSRCALHVDPVTVSPDGKHLEGDRELNAIQLVETVLRNLNPAQRARVLYFCAERAKTPG